MQRIGLLEAAPVALDGIDLFQIASPAVFNRNEPGGQVPVEVRARQIESNLNQVISQSLQVADDDSDGALPSSAPIEVIIEQINGQPVLFATSNNLVEPKVLLTITDTDAQFQAISQTILAERWQEILQIALRRAIDARQPDALRRQIRKVVWIVLATVLATLVLTGIWQVLGWRKHTLEERRTVQGSQWEPPLDGDDAIYPHHQLKQLLRYQISVDQRLQLVAFLRWLMFWSIAFVWIAGTAGVLYLFPQTRRYAFGLFSTPVLLLLAWFITGLLNRLANIGIERTAQAWGKNELGSLEDLQRKSMRVSTITGALKGLKTAVIYALALLLVLQILKIGPASLLAFGAVAALALSFGAQSLVRDLVNGFLILLEDQYAIGDLVATGNTTGIVENLNLRVTKIRGEDGRLVTLPNSLIAQVDNLSRNWSRANLTVDVGYDTDVNYALYVMQDVAQAMAKDPAWQYAILDPVEMIGVDAMTHAGITIRLWIRTRPLKQFLVGREFRRRLRIAFGQVGIAIGVPQQALSGVREEVLEPDPSHGSTPLPSEDSHAQVNSVDPAATG
ncbi:MAG: mechanosensitive ion channel family protein [Nodosilinea sp.]